MLMRSTTLRILIVDDSATFREALRSMLEAHNNWEVCGEAVDAAEGIEKNRLLTPHLIIMDLAMPGMSGIAAASEILRESPEIPILLLTVFYTDQLAEEAHKVGIRATISKTAAREIVGAIDKIAYSGGLTAPNR